MKRELKVTKALNAQQAVAELKTMKRELKDTNYKKLPKEERRWSCRVKNDDA
jgi:hypothetical protein